MTETRLWELVTAAFREWWNDNTPQLAAALAFYMIFSLAPILVVAVEVASLVFSQEQVRAQIVSQIDSLVGGTIGAAVGEVLAGISREDPFEMRNSSDRSRSLQGTPGRNLEDLAEKADYLLSYLLSFC